MNIVDRTSPVTYSFKDNTVKETKAITPDLNKAGIPVSAESGNVNVLQEFSDPAVTGKELGDYKSSFIDYGLFTVKQINETGGTVLATRIATGKEAYKTIDVYLDDANSKLEYGLSRFKNVKPTSAYQRGEDCFSTEVDDYSVTEVDDAEDILAANTDWTNASDLAFMFTIQTFKPTNFKEFSVVVSKLTYGEVDDIISKSSLTKLQVKSKFIKLTVTDVSGSKLESFICSLEDGFIDNKGNDYSINEIINLTSNYIFITKKRNTLGNLTITDIDDLEVVFNNSTLFYNRYAPTFNTDGTSSVEFDTLDYFKDSIEMKYKDSTEFDNFKGTLNETYLKSKYPGIHSKTTVETLLRGTLDESKTMRLDVWNNGTTDDVYLKRDVNTFIVDPTSADFNLAANTTDQFSTFDDTLDAKIYVNETEYITVLAASITKVDNNNITFASGGISEENLNKLKSQFKVTNNNVIFTYVSFDEMVKPLDVIVNSTSLYYADGSSNDVVYTNIETPDSSKITYDIISSEILVDNASIYNVEDTLSINHIETINTIDVSTNLGKDGLNYSTYVKLDGVDSDYFDNTVAINVDLDESYTNSTGVVLNSNKLYAKDSDYFEGNVNTNSIWFGSLVININSVYSVDSYGNITVGEVFVKNIIEETATNTQDSYTFKQFNSPDTDAVVDAYYADGLELIYKNGTLDDSVYGHFFKDNNVGLNNLLDVVAKDYTINEVVQASIVSTVSSRQNCFGDIMCKNCSVSEERSAIDTYKTSGELDPDGNLTYTTQDNFLIEQHFGWTEERIDDNSKIVVPTLGKQIGKRLNALANSPVLNIWGINDGESLDYTTNITVQEEDLDFYKKMRINADLKVRYSGTYAWHNYTTYRKESDLNKVRNVQVLIYLVNAYYPILMKYIKKPIYTLEQTTNNIQNIKNDLFAVLKNVNGAFAVNPELELVSTADELDQGIIIIKNKLYFSSDIEAIEIIFETNDVGELYFDILSQQ